ncbi:MAG: cobyrinic acid a,c-diamide synthase [Nocardioidaceae bacterium]|nr:cobyrinic acid a,c-diamide synthase [Nocardioidaceae bacterium]
MVSLPRLIIAAPASGHGKTTIATGLMAALSAAGHTVSGHKVGPDYIDPGYHALATGLPGRNLDPHMVGEERLVPLLLAGAKNAEIAIVEGVMGLYDGQIGGNGFSSTAHVATVTRTPVVLVVDISHASRSIAAVVQGMVAFDPQVRIVGVILNKAGSQRHADEVCSALETTGVPVLGVLQRDDGIVAPSRHLGLVPADERHDAARTLDRLATQIAAKVDLAAIMRLAREAPDLDAEPWDAADAVLSSLWVSTSSTNGSRVERSPLDEPSPLVEPVETHETPVVAIAGGRAFTFRYAETEELLRAAGCDVAYFDPLNDEALPEGTAGIYLGGGFPEVHATGLTANEPLRRALREAVRAGTPTVAECAGLLYLCRTVDGSPMISAIDAEARMTPRLTLSYRQAVAPQDTLLAAAGSRVNGHEFHRTTVTPVQGADAAWIIAGESIGFSTPTLHASYLHTHWAGYPQMAARFARAVHAYAPVTTAASTTTTTSTSTSTSPSGAKSGRNGSSDNRFAPLAGRNAPLAGTHREKSVDLAHHGDAEVDGLIDFAVNVFDGARPEWLDAALQASLAQTHTYPHAAEAEAAIAARHLRGPGEVLATAGAAEAFTLIARARAWQRPVVVNPQFTEPEAALLAAGHQVERVQLEESSGFRLDHEAIPYDADLVVIGNPTNPTGVLHPESVLRLLARPGRTLVVDEAFMDSVEGERGSLASVRLPGLLVVRSLTKLWSIPGVRAGYVVGAESLITDLRAQQSPWSLSTTAAAAIVACTDERAILEAGERARTITKHRQILTDGLAELGLHVIGGSQAPFVLVKVPDHLHASLRDVGYAVRRADTFPGLGRGWVRIAVRKPETTRSLLAAIASLL